MLNNLNPSFVLDLTATPKKNSNILSYVDARELKKENMVKLPVVVYNRTSRQSVIQDAIQLRGSIERQAIAEKEADGEYIRPIVLFQAQPKVSEDSETFDKIKAMLVDMGIPKEEIAVKTSKVDELGKTDLMSRDCPIRPLSPDAQCCLGNEWHPGSRSGGRYGYTPQPGASPCFLFSPIVLFQAQPKINEDSETFDKIKTMLVDMGIPKEEIAVKTSKVDESSPAQRTGSNCSASPRSDQTRRCGSRPPLPRETTAGAPESAPCPAYRPAARSHP